VNEGLVHAMSKAATNYSSDIDEFNEVGLTPIESDLVKSPRVAESPINMECTLRDIITLGSKPGGASLIIGEVVLVHIQDEIWSNGDVRVEKLKAVGRLGGNLYCRTGDIFEIKRPDL
jgi:flavin reductase (DIM6/NTAB) family NADH-FMN oxidoreductase RutF